MSLPMPKELRGRSLCSGRIRVPGVAVVGNTRDFIGRDRRIPVFLPRPHATVITLETLHDGGQNSLRYTSVTVHVRSKLRFQRHSRSIFFPHHHELLFPLLFFFLQTRFAGCPSCRLLLVLHLDSGRRGLSAQ